MPEPTFWPPAARARAALILDDSSLLPFVRTGQRLTILDFGADVSPWGLSSQRAAAGKLAVSPWTARATCLVRLSHAGSSLPSLGSTPVQMSAPH